MSYREFLTKEQAIELVGGKRDFIHCFWNPFGNLIGHDWEWNKFEIYLDGAERIELGGETTESLGHPLAVYAGKQWYFFERVKNENQ